MENEIQKNNAAGLTLSFEFDAPVSTVFSALSDPDALAEWWGPAGFKMTVVRMEFKPKGICLFKMENEAATMWAKFVYTRIAGPHVVEFVLSFSDESGGLTRAPFFDAWPREILNTISLREENGRTFVQHEVSPVNATAAEVSCFNENQSSLEGGTTAAWNKLKLVLKSS